MKISRSKTTCIIRYSSIWWKLCIFLVTPRAHKRTHIFIKHKWVMQCLFCIMQYATIGQYAIRIHHVDLGVWNLLHVTLAAAKTKTKHSSTLILCGFVIVFVCGWVGLRVDVCIQIWFYMSNLFIHINTIKCDFIIYRIRLGEIQNIETL